MAASLVEINLHVLFTLQIKILPHFSHVIGTFQERAINDAL